MTNEELAVVLEAVASDVESVFSGDQSDQLREAAARLRQQSEDSARLDTVIPCPRCNGRGLVDTAFRCVMDGEDDADDYCVLDHDRPQDCVYAPDVLKAGGKHMCGEWRRVAIDKARNND